MKHLRPDEYRQALPGIGSATHAACNELAAAPTPARAEEVAARIAAAARFVSLFAAALRADREREHDG